MPLYSYKAADGSNTVTTGTLTATNKEEAAQIITKRQLQPISIKAVVLQTNQASTIPPVEIITFCRYMAAMLHAGLSLSEGVEVLKNETEHPLMKQILNDMLYHLQQGQSLNSVFKLYPNVFSDFFITLVGAGEVSGTLAQTFSYLEDQLRAEYSLSQKIKSALMYPAIVVLAMLGIGILMFFFVLPQIAEVFLRMTLPMPKFTTVMFNFSLKLAAIRIPFIIGMFVFLIAAFVFVRQPAGKKLVIKLISPIPLVKNLIQKVDLARFSRIFSTLLSSGVPITQSLEISLNSLSLPRYEEHASEVIDRVSQGKSIASSFKEYDLFPSLITQMIAAGEKSGSLDDTLSDLAVFYDAEVEEDVKKATQLLEPILMLIVGIGVGAMILSIIAPLYSVVGNLQNLQR